MFECTYVGDGIKITPNPTAKMEELQRQVTWLQQQKDALSQGLSTAQSRQSEVQRDIDAILNEIRVRAQEKEKVEQEYAEKEAVLDALLKKLEGENIIYSNRSNENNLLQKQVDAAKEALADTEERRNKVFNEIAPLELAVEQLASERDLRKGELDFLAAEYQRQGVVTQKAIEDLLKAEQEAVAKSKDFERKSEEVRQMSMAAELRLADLQAMIRAAEEQAAAAARASTSTSTSTTDTATQSTMEQNALLQKQNLELQQEVEFLKKKIAAAYESAQQASSTQTTQIAGQLSGIRMGLIRGDSRQTREALAGLGALMNSEAKLTFDGKVIAGPGWVDAFRKQVRKPYNVPVPEGIDYRMPTLSDALNVTGTGLATFQYAALEDRAGAKLNGLSGVTTTYTGKNPELIQVTLACCPDPLLDPIGSGKCALSGEDARFVERINGIGKHFRAVFGREPTNEEIEYYGAMYWCARTDDGADTNMQKTMQNIRTQFMNYENKARNLIIAKGGGIDEGTPEWNQIYQEAPYKTTMPLPDYFPGGPSKYAESFRSRTFIGSILSDPQVGKYLQQLMDFAKSQAQEATVDMIGSGGEGTGGGSRPPGKSAGLSLGMQIGLGVAALAAVGGIVYYATRNR